MVRYEILILDENDVRPSKRDCKADEITKMDIIYPAYGSFDMAYGVIIRMNGTEKILKDRGSDTSITISI